MNTILIKNGKIQNSCIKNKYDIDLYNPKKFVNPPLFSFQDEMNKEDTARSNAVTNGNYYVDKTGKLIFEV